MTTLQLFVAPREQPALVERLSRPHELRAYSYEGGRISEISLEELSQTRGQLVSRVFLVPAGDDWEQSEKPRPRERGWIDITVGRLTDVDGQRVLTLTTLQGENRKGVVARPSTWLRAFQKDIQPAVTFGVRGTNVVHGGSSEYDDIGYSAEASKMAREGVIWKQYANDNSVFEPI
jgi:hypothetical protein